MTNCVGWHNIVSHCDVLYGDVVYDVVLYDVVLHGTSWRCVRLWGGM